MSATPLKSSIGRRVAAVLAAGALFGLGACAEVPAESASEDGHVARVEPIAGTDISKVTLSEEAARRIEVRSEPVRTAKVRGTTHKIVPYAAVVYLADGAAYAYSNPQGLEFVRVPLRIDFIDEDLAALKTGPPVGTRVATVGVAELLGTEFEVGH